MEAKSPSKIDLDELSAKVEAIVEREIGHLSRMTELSDKETKNLEILNKVLTVCMVRRDGRLGHNPNRDKTDDELMEDFE